MNGAFLDALRHAYNTRMEAIDTWVDVLVPPKAEAFVVGGAHFVQYAAYTQRVQLDDDIYVHNAFQRTKNDGPTPGMTSGPRQGHG